MTQPIQHPEDNNNDTENPVQAIAPELLPLPTGRYVARGNALFSIIQTQFESVPFQYRAIVYTLFVNWSEQDFREADSALLVLARQAANETDNPDFQWHFRSFLTVYEQQLIAYDCIVPEPDNDDLEDTEPYDPNWLADWNEL